MTTPHAGNPLLLPHHAELLRLSGIAEDVAIARGYQSIVTVDQLSNLEPKLSRAQRIVPALLIPLHDTFGNQSLYQLRPDSPRISERGRPIKYETPANSESSLDINPLFRKNLFDPNIPLFITEGIRKGDAAASQGLTCISLLGVWNWRGRNEFGGTSALADWDQIAFNKRQAIIVFDSDVSQNREVYSSLYRFKHFLERKSARVYAVYLPSGPNGEKVGLDDYLATHSKKELMDLITETLIEPPSYDVTKPINGYQLTDLGNSERLADTYGHLLRYVEAWGSWLFYDGRYWSRDETGQVHRFAQQVVRSLYAEAAKIEDDDDRKKLGEHAHRSESEARLKAMVSLARYNIRIAALSSQFDQHPFLLNVLNGTINLRTGHLRPHSPEDMLSKIAPVNFDPSHKPYYINEPEGQPSPAKDWFEFLDQVTSHDPLMQTYLQRIAGYCLTGSTQEGAIFYILGPTRTGKTTWVQALSNLLGEYSWKTSFETFLVSRRGSSTAGGARDDVASMEGKRLVISSEVSHGQRFNEAVLKELTGEDDISARHLYRSSRVIKPEMKLMFAANDVPHLRSDDDASWARFKIISFLNTEFADRKFLQLKQRVRDVPYIGSVILSWAVQGCLDWQEYDSLAEPLTVSQSTASKRDEFDPLTEWLAAEVTILPPFGSPEQPLTEQESEAKNHRSVRVPFSDLWESYQGFFSEDRSSKRLGRKNFGKALDAHGIVGFSVGGILFRRNIKLNNTLEFPGDKN